MLHRLQPRHISDAGVSPDKDEHCNGKKMQPQHEWTFADYIGSGTLVASCQGSVLIATIQSPQRL